MADWEIYLEAIGDGKRQKAVTADREKRKRVDIFAASLKSFLLEDIAPTTRPSFTAVELKRAGNDCSSKRFWHQVFF